MVRRRIQDFGEGGPAWLDITNVQGQLLLRLLTDGEEGDTYTYIVYSETSIAWAAPSEETRAKCLTPSCLKKKSLV
jgi:hypothetical protein